MIFLNFDLLGMHIRKETLLWLFLSVIMTIVSSTVVPKAISQSTYMMYAFSTRLWFAWQVRETRFITCKEKQADIKNLNSFFREINFLELLKNYWNWQMIAIIEKFKYWKIFSFEKQLKNWHIFWHIGTPVPKIGTSFGTLARQFQKLARLWHVGTPSWKIGTPLALWHAYWHIGTLARKNEMLVLFWHVGTLAR